jgi:elongation factor G
MKEYPTESIRNIALVSHSSAGKTMLTEACLHYTGVTTRMGKVEDGTTVADFDEEENRRGISIYTSVVPVESSNTKINFLDTPGYTDFIGEVISALQVSDSALLLVDAVSGAEVGTEVAWDYVNRANLPRFVAINKMNRENANYNSALASIEEMSEARLVPIQIPMGEKLEFSGVIDLLTMKAYPGDGSKPTEIPAEYSSQAEEARTVLVEAAAEGEDDLLEKYLESGELSQDEVIRGLRKVVLSGDFVPVFLGAYGAEIGIGPLLNSLEKLAPSPADVPAVKMQGKAGEELLTAKDSGPLALFVWKTTADPFVGKQTYFRVYSGTAQADSRVWNCTKNAEERFGTLQIPRGKENIPVKVLHAGDIGTVAKLNETVTGDMLCDKAHQLTMPPIEYPSALYQVAVHPKTQADSTKISPTLTRLTEEDMTLSWHNEPATGQTILSGMGDQHIDVAIRRAETKFQVNLIADIPKVPFQESITGKGSAMYRHKKQTGGSGQFGEVHLRVEPSEGEFEVVNEIFGGAISSSYLPAIEKGIRNTMKEGVLAGYPVNALRVAVFDGKEHPVDSKPIAFEIAGREAFKLAFKEANPVLLEPIMLVKVTVPESNMGDVLGDMNTRRARVMGMENDKGKSIVTAHVPLAEMQRYTTQLRSITGGRGIFAMEFDHYEVVPSHLAQEIIANRQKEMQHQKQE